MGCPLEAEDLRVSVLYEIDGDFVSGTFSGDLEKAKAHVQNLANLVSAQYALQAGVEVEGDVFIDTRADPHGHRYVAPTDRDQLRESGTAGTAMTRTSRNRSRATRWSTSSAARHSLSRVLWATPTGAWPARA